MKHQKDCKTILVEYISSLSEEDLYYVGSRLVERYVHDMSQALEFMSKKPQIDQILSNASSADELYQLCDVIKDIVLREAKKRKINILNPVEKVS